LGRHINQHQLHSAFHGSPGFHLHVFFIFFLNFCQFGYIPHHMAKKSWIERNKRKQRTVNKYAKLRAKLKAEKDYEALTMLPRDASPTRVVNRCEVTGRRRGYLRRFRMSRITFRELASNGMIPGVTKSSW